MDPLEPRREERDFALRTKTWPFALTRRGLVDLLPALCATALLLTLLGVCIWRAKAAEGGRFVYPIDDVYMHLAVAKNIVRHGSWALTSYNGFCHCISSLIWPWLVALTFALFGFHEYYPIVLNGLAAVGMLFYAGRMIRRSTDSIVVGFVALGAIVYLTPLDAIVALGMEHSLQILVSLVFVDLAARMLADTPRVGAGRFAGARLCVLGFLLVTSRYEGLFLIAIVGLLLLCRRRWILALVLGFVAAAPLVAFGLYAVKQGWPFFPTSLLLKGNTRPELTLAGLLQYFGKGFALLDQNPHFLMTVLALTVALGASLQRKWDLWNYSTLLLLIPFVTTLEHLQFASLGWFYRYEAYLIVLVIVGLAIDVGQALPRPAAEYWGRAPGLVHAGVLGVAALLFGLPLWERATVAQTRIARASYNIYEQQYQMGRFIREFYTGRGLAANDIGAITWLGDPRLVDMMGLATYEVLRARLAHRGSPEFIRELYQKNDVELALVYEAWNDWFHGPLPEWVPVGRWTIRQNEIAADPTVVFYAVRPELVPRLTQELQTFASSLPADVVQDGTYIGRSSDVKDTHGPETGPDRTLYWTAQRGEFELYPVHGEALDSDETTLQLSYLPTMPDQRIEIFFNDELVSNAGVLPDKVHQWKTVRVKAKWRPGKNVLIFAGHGSLLPVPGDTRPLMFQILDPLQRLNPDGSVTKPGVPPGLP